jgi:hypothetical protein
LALRQAALAQLVEQLICNQQVIGSTPVRGSQEKRNTFSCGASAKEDPPISASVIFDDETEVIAP